MIKRILLFFCVWRMALFCIPVIAAHVLLYRAGFAYTTLSYFQPALRDNFLAFWANFDGIHYLEIAGRGYQMEARFFPLYPLFIHVTSLGLFSTYSLGAVVAGLLVANVFFAAGLILFFQLVQLDFDKHIARNTILALLFFPTAFFFVSVYAESLFFFLAIASFWCARKQRWWLAAVCASFLCVTRIVGIAILPALIVELMLQKAPRKTFFSLLLVPVGFISWLIFNQEKWGNALSFLYGQGDLGNGRSTTALINPLQTVFRYTHIFMTVSTSQYEFWVAVIEFLTLGIALTLLIAALRQKIRLSYLVFGALCILIPVLSGTLTGLPRYILVAFPIFIVLGRVRNPALRIAMLIIGAVGSCLLLALFARGYYVA